jgi:hypothetical protein
MSPAIVSRRAFFVTAAASSLMPRVLASAGPRVRHAHHTAAGKEMLRLYARAVGLMRDKALYDDHHPFSWSWQARTHRAEGNETAADAVARYLQGVSDETRMLALATWSTCRAHADWRGEHRHFLPWHRAYLGVFEAVVRQVLFRDGVADADTFALPYWDWLTPGQTALPPELLRGSDPELAPLFHEARRADANDGASIIDATEAAAPLAEVGFDTVGVIIRFSGMLDRSPHGTVHSTIGGDMGAVPTAARDPVFWLHHCAIDRMWDLWLAAGGGRRNPDDPAWLDRAFTFAVPGPGGLPLRYDVSTAEAAQAATFGFAWDTLDLPGGITLAQAETGAAPVFGRFARIDPGAGRATAAVQPPPIDMTTMRRMQEAGVWQGPRFYLVLDDLRSAGPTGTTYDVILTPPGGEPRTVGTVGFFDAAPLDAPPTEPLERFASFDVTETVAAAVAVMGPMIYENPPVVRLEPRGPEAAGSTPVVGRAFLALQ